MALLSLWKSNPDEITKLGIDQIVATAGNGKLRDESPCSSELREYLSQVSSELLFTYAQNCLNEAFANSGYVLQDIVNELGRRLEYSVNFGRYQGAQGAIGYDGIWSSPEGYDLIVEVKTTDTYRVALDTIAAYRSKLAEAASVGPGASVLIVVGRQDTGELEAQVRGSRHAWDMRLISVESLIDLVRLKEGTEAGITGAKIRSILRPMEFTRLDALVEVMFATAKDIEQTAEIESLPLKPANYGAQGSSSGWVFTSADDLATKRQEILSALGKATGKQLIKRSTAQYWDASHEFRIACTLSKRYTKKGIPPYWYAYHPTWHAFLAGGTSAFLVLGCMDLPLAFVLPQQLIVDHLQELQTTSTDKETYWHVKILEPTAENYALQLPKTGNSLDLSSFVLKLT